MKTNKKLEKIKLLRKKEEFLNLIDYRAIKPRMENYIEYYESVEIIRGAKDIDEFDMLIDAYFNSDNTRFKIKQEITEEVIEKNFTPDEVELARLELEKLKKEAKEKGINIDETITSDSLK